MNADTVAPQLRTMHVFESPSSSTEHFLFREDFPALLVANKVDLVHQRVVKEEEGQEMAKRFGVSIPHWKCLSDINKNKRMV